jgi:hypothetical protein
MMLSEITRGAVLGLSAAAAPGPLQAMVVARSVRVGPWRALPLALVPAASDPVAIGTVLLVLSQVPPAFLRSITAVGAAVVLWMAVATVRSALRGNDPGAGNAPPSRGFLAIAAVNVTNPGAWIFWSAVGTAHRQRLAPAPDPRRRFPGQLLRLHHRRQRRRGAARRRDGARRPAGGPGAVAGLGRGPARVRDLARRRAHPVNEPANPQAGSASPIRSLPPPSGLG